MIVKAETEHVTGNCPWILFNDKIYVGKRRESHFDLTGRLVPEDMQWGLLDEEGVVSGRVAMDSGRARIVWVYSKDRVPNQTLHRIAKEFGVPSVD